MTWRLIHIPKTAGHAFRQAYGSGPARQYGNTHWPSRSFPDDGAEHVTITRNPFDRAVSLCAYLMRGELQDRVLTVGEFHQWIRDGMADNDHPLPTPDGPTLHVTDPQTHWLNGRERRFRFEHLQDDVAAWATDRGWPVRQLGFVNTSNRLRPWPQYYTDEITELVVGRYREDFENLGYEMETYATQT
jgi:hypothetical protein